MISQNVNVSPSLYLSYASPNEYKMYHVRFRISIWFSVIKKENVVLDRFDVSYSMSQTGNENRFLLESAQLRLIGLVFIRLQCV